MNFPFTLQENREFDAVGFGTNAVDFLIRVPEYPDFNSKVELIDYSRAAGGEIATSMVGLQRLGLKTLYVGRFGDDDAGRFGIRSLEDEGVDVSLTERIAGAQTQIAFIVIDERSGERTVIWKRDARLTYERHEAPIAAVGRAKVLHFTHHDAEACVELAREAKKTGTVVSIDVDNTFDKMDELLPLVDILIASAELPGRMFGIENEHDALNAMKQRYGAPVIGITLGEEGSLLLCGDSFIETRGFAVLGGCRDTTGAGDSFRAGLLFGLLTGESVDEAARIANGVAALKCRAIGARTSLPTSAELQTLLKNN